MAVVIVILYIQLSHKQTLLGIREKVSVSRTVSMSINYISGHQRNIGLMSAHRRVN